MHYTDLVFDLYGTLVDIHTEENNLVWEKTALYFGFYGAHCTGPALKNAFQTAMAQREAQAGQSYECFPDIPFERVMAQLFRQWGIDKDADILGVNAAQLFRISSIEYIRLYPGVQDALLTLRQNGYRLWLLSNAQQIFTAYELRLLGLGEQFDGILLSSDYGYRKPDSRFYRALTDTQGLDVSRCLMIGNDRQTDIAGAQKIGMATLFLHTGLTPPDQAPADPMLHPSVHTGPHWEYEGDEWNILTPLICGL